MCVSAVPSRGTATAGPRRCLSPGCGGFRCYLGIRQRLVEEDALGFGGGAGAGRPDERFPEAGTPQSAQPPHRRTLISVVAEINLARSTGRIAYVNPVERGVLSAEDGASPVLLRFKSSDGRPLSVFRAGLQVFAVEATDEDRHALCSVIVAPDPLTSVIELYVHDRLADTFTSDPAVPEVGPITLKDEPGGVAIAWGQPTTRDIRHSYNVQISEDSGRTWQTVAVRLKAPYVRVPKESVSRDRAVLVRVQATDGFRVAQSVVTWQAGN